ncbi:DgyrCDS14542 [Dimorphilus gyrociliatus]|uniref:DgyrCDS14542 n=1 Tax=Dimorphilus gyrociliatus TaxID=2664684 RepID=A0A7I8WE49_9ANNE|nr:DgyrCDS14542 [Dimorphilus gyrociliatus]
MSARYESVNQTDTLAVTFTHEQQVQTSRCKLKFRSLVPFLVVVLVVGSFVVYYVMSGYSVKPKTGSHFINKPKIKLVEQDYAKLLFETSARTRSFCKITRQMDENEESWRIAFNVFTPFERKVLEGNLKIKRFFIKNSMCEKGIWEKPKKS